METYFIAHSKMYLSYEKGAKSSQLKEVAIALDISPNLDENVYFDSEGDMTKEAVKPLTQAFVQGLVANVKAAHHAAHWNELEHFKYILEKLNEAFAHVTETPIKSSDKF